MVAAARAVAIMAKAEDAVARVEAKAVPAEAVASLVAAVGADSLAAEAVASPAVVVVALRAEVEVADKAIP